MSDSDDEIRRLERIRDQQIAARDPKQKQHTYTQHYRKQVSAQKKITFASILGTFSNKLKGGFVGGLLGFIAWVVLASLVTAPWTNLAGIAAVVVGIAFGVLVGASLDWRDDLRDF